jgi:hypothetical protein
MRTALGFNAAVLVVASMAIFAGVSAEERSESFDADPQWDGRNNRSQAFDARSVVQDFGFSPTNHCRDGAGELGGFITPAAEPAYYAKAIEPQSFDDRATAAGTFLATGRQFHILVGFFNADTLNEWRTPNTISLRLYGRGDVFYAYVEYCTAKWRAGGDNPQPFARTSDGANGRRIPIEFARSEPHSWTLEYDPGGNNGQGVVTATIDGVQAVCHLDPGHRADGAMFNRFGVQTVMKQVDSGGEVWIDDLKINGATEDFHRDPGWDSRNNRRRYETANVRPRFDFGHCLSQHAGGKRAGEIGGLVFRGDCRDENRMGYYGDRLQKLNLKKPLRASGRITLTRGVSDSTTLFGFFHSADSMKVSDSQSSGFPKNFLGIAIEGPSREGFFVYPAYRVASGESGWANARRERHIYPNGKAHDWTLAYSPDADGGGAITVSLDRQTVRLVLPQGHRETETEFNRFGFVTTWIDGNGQHVYFDDLTYTWKQ